jgi:integrase/recombinase XerD
MDIRLYIAKRMQEGLKNSTLNIMVGQIKTFYQWMYDNEYIRKNPSKLVKNVKFDKYIRKALTEDEFEKLKYACKTPREHAIVSLFYSTASRVSEIYALNKDDIDWYNDTIKVFGKGRKERYVYLSANAKLYLSKYLESRNDSESALFVGSRIPHKRLSCRAIEDEFNDLGKRAGITSRVYPHLLRHTMATNWLRTGGDIAEVSKILGHSNISTTQIYAQVNNDNIKSSFKKHML